MRPDRVVVLTPHVDQDLRFRQAVENLPIQQFIPQLPIEALNVSIFPRTARFNEQRFHAYLVSHSLTVVAVNSGPLSLRRCSGTPRVAINQARRSSTSSLVSFRATSMARHSRVYSSTMVSILNGTPSCVRPLTKSYAHT